MSTSIVIHEPTSPHDLSVRERAVTVDLRVREINQSAQRDFIEMGMLIVEAEEDALWAHMEDPDGNPYNSLDHWISSALPYGRTSALSARKAVRELREIPMDRLKAIPRVNLQALIKIPEKQRTPDMIEAATNLPEIEFNQKIHVVSPKSLKEQKSHISFKMTKSQFKTVARAMARASEELINKNEKSTKEAQLQTICAAYLDIQGVAKRPPKAAKKAS